MIVVGTKNGLPAASDLENDSTVTGMYISDALDNLNSAIGSIVVPVNASDLTNDSTVIGVTVADALNTLSSGGGGGGPTLSETIVATPTPGQIVSVTHPAVPMVMPGSGEIQFSGIATVIGPTHDSNPSMWTDENVNTGGATWVQDVGTVRDAGCYSGVGIFGIGNYIYVGVDWASATKKGLIKLVQNSGSNPIISYVLTFGSDFTDLDDIKEWTGVADGASATVNKVWDSNVSGHFSVNPGPKVKPRNRMYLNSYGSYITTIQSMDADPTLPNSVILSSGVGSDVIFAINGVYGSGHSVYGWGGDLGGLDVYYSISDVLFDFADISSAISVEMGTYYISGYNPRCAVSLDNGSTWLAFDGAVWQTITLNNLYTSGMRVDTVVGPWWLDSSGGALSAGDWSDLFALMLSEGAGLNVRIVIGADPGVGGVGLSGSRLYWHESDTIQPMVLVSRYSSDPGFTNISRISNTETRFTINIGSMQPYPIDWHCQVWT